VTLNDLERRYGRYIFFTLRYYTEFGKRGF